MNKIYQKMYLKKKSPAKGVLSGFIYKVILRDFYSESHPCFNNGSDFYSESQPLSIKRAGFTLIEMLVVVLIIGILAAVAVPQYRLSVEKARAAEALSMVKTLWQAQQVYYWANGSYHDNINELDVSIAGHDAMLDNVPRKETQYFSYGVKKTYDYVAANRLPVDRVYGFAVRAEGLVCVSYSDLGKKICQNFAQQQLSGNIWLISSF